MAPPFWVWFAVLGVGWTDEPKEYQSLSAQGQVPMAQASSTAALSGRILVRDSGTDRIVELRDDHDDVVRLLGPEANALANVRGGDVVVWGTWDANPGFVVMRFRVTGMHGRPALDGVLELSGKGFAVRLSDNSVRQVEGLKGKCAAYVGARVWVVERDRHERAEAGFIAPKRDPARRITYSHPEGRDGLESGLSHAGGNARTLGPWFPSAGRLRLDIRLTTQVEPVSSWRGREAATRLPLET